MQLRGAHLSRDKHELPVPVEQVQDALDQAAQHAPKRCREFVSADMVARVIRAASKYLELEETLVQVCSWATTPESRR